jgi:aerobic-type carbon monoxide dehydrogenase small subunit (CoxS/CutS family)
MRESFMRIMDHPVLGSMPPRREVEFFFEGDKLNGMEGEPIAAALMAVGIRVLRRSKWYGQPRGIFCAIGLCTDCMVVLDGVPNVRSCVTPLREGMDIRMQLTSDGMRTLR